MFFNQWEAKVALGSAARTTVPPARKTPSDLANSWRSYEPPGSRTGSVSVCELTNLDATTHAVVVVVMSRGISFGVPVVPPESWK